MRRETTKVDQIAKPKTELSLRKGTKNVKPPKAKLSLQKETKNVKSPKVAAKGD